jgi:hypothetical protein
MSLRYLLVKHGKLLFSVRIPANMMIKILEKEPSLLEAMSAKFTALSPVMVTAAGYLKIAQAAINKSTNKKSKQDRLKEKQKKPSVLPILHSRNISVPKSKK